MEKLPKEAIFVLREQIKLVQNPPAERWELYLSKDLPPLLHRKLVEVFEHFGGKKKSGTNSMILFPLKWPVEDYINTIVETGKVPDVEHPKHFNTPVVVADKMIDIAMPEAYLFDDEHFHILEPCAGRGGILDRLEYRGYRGLVTAVESDGDSCDVLRSSFDFGDKWLLYERNYMLWADTNPDDRPEYNAILLDPPFKTKGKPQWYVYWFLNCLHKLGNDGILVCIVPDTAFVSDHKDCKTFRAVMKINHGERTMLDFDDFQSSGSRAPSSIVWVRKNWSDATAWSEGKEKD